jgi:molybdenum cofactor cytidylyltransferase
VTIAAVVLAAGSGSRFAADDHKLLTEFRGRPLVLWAVDAAAGAGLDEVIVITGAVPLDDALPRSVTRVHNPMWAAGMGTSLGVAIDTATERDHEAIVVGLADQPFIEAEAWRRVARSSAAPIVVATYDGKRRNPVKLAAEVWPLLDTSGDVGARSLMARRPDLVGEVACPGIPADVDTVEDLAQWS